MMYSERGRRGRTGMAESVGDRTNGEHRLTEDHAVGRTRCDIKEEMDDALVAQDWRPRGIKQERQAVVVQKQTVE